jgi:hypothetical protein
MCWGGGGFKINDSPKAWASIFLYDVRRSYSCGLSYSQSSGALEPKEKEIPLKAGL